MTTELRTNKPHINIVTRSGAVTGNDKAYGKKEIEATWVRKTTEKALSFDVYGGKEN